MKTLDLELDLALLELLRARLRAIEFEVGDIARDATDVGDHEAADRLNQLLLEISYVQAIPEVLLSRRRRLP